MSKFFQPPLRFADLPPGNRLFLMACRTTSDPSMAWGTEVELGPLRDELARRNRDGTFLLTPVHFFVKAVERAVADHPEVNRRIQRGLVRPYHGRHIILSTQDGNGHAGVMILRDVQEMGVEEIGRAIWTRLLEERVTGGRRDPAPARRIDTLLRIYRLLGPRISAAAFRMAMGWMDRRGARRLGLGPGTPVLVNYLGGPGMPPMRSYSPSRLPLGFPLTNVTMGAPELRPVASEAGIEARWVATLHVRSDHRLVDGFQLGRFTGTIKAYLEHPERLTG